MPVNSIDVPAGALVYSYPRFGTDSSGNVTGLLRPDGQAYRTERVDNGFCLMGDSRMARSAPTSESDRGFWNWVMIKTEQRGVIVDNVAVGGTRTDQFVNDQLA